ncbi:hypothetical protein [Kitasatospora sp. NPDC058190]|uniref:hypothetical protein n=1 Tax=Kitasatospora sp. NPDC058190 TaxID=3346371 RepID=UPI0036DED751
MTGGAPIKPASDLGGSATPAPADYSKLQYGGSTSVSGGHGSYQSPETFTAPDVPPAPGKSKGTTVSTPSLDLFADNIDRLIAPVDAAGKALQPIDVHPGAFYHAWKMRGTVNGGDGDDGLKQQCVKALGDLSNALVDLREGVRTLSGQYKSIEEANKMTAKDLHDAMSSASDKFNTVVKDAGGDAATAGGGSQSGGGGQGDGDKNHGNGHSGNDSKSN